MLQRLFARAAILTHLTFSRFRAIRYRIFGARIGRKCSFGCRVHLQRPWTVSIGCRTTFEADVWLKVEEDSARVKIGQFAFLGRGCELDCTRSIVIGDRSLIGPNVFITDHHHNIRRDSLISEQGCSSRPVVIGNDVWIGTKAVILPGVTVHDGAVVGAGAVVTRDVPPYEIWGGVPARKIKERS